jgi:hypothetical protein
MKIKLSEINRLTTFSLIKERIVIVILAILLGTSFWYLIDNSSKILVIPRSNTKKKSCDFN